MFKKFLIILFITFFLSFKSVSAESSFIFTANGDIGNDTSSSSAFTKFLKAIKADNSSFHLALGDLSYVLNAEQSWANYIHSILGNEFPFEIVAGNHDVGEHCCGDINKYIQYLPNKINSMPANSDYGKQYYFDYPVINPLVRVIMISPAHFGWTYNKGTPQYTFTKNSILDARSKNIPWVVVGLHKNCIEMGVKSCEIGKDLTNLLLGADLGTNNTLGTGVDLILMGHNHLYSRSKQINLLNAGCVEIIPNTYNPSCVYSSTSPFTKGKGSIFVISGAGGVSLYNINTSDSEAPYFVSWSGKNINPSYGYSKITVTGSKLDVSFVPVTGTFTDSFSITNETSPLLYDLNNDSVFNMSDILILVSKIFNDNTVILNPNSKVDTNSDGSVNLIDLINFVVFFFR